MNSTPSIHDAATLDVRPIPCREKHARIFQRWDELATGAHFILLNDHDPIPLRYQFEAEYPGAYSWDYVERGPEEFRVRITKLQTTTPRPIRPPSGKSGGCGNHGHGHGHHAHHHEHEVAVLDVRGLEPPEPLMRILAALESLPAGSPLVARTDREPCHLFPEATHRGFSHVSQQQADGSWLTLLQRA